MISTFRAARWEPLIGSALLFFILDLWVHRFPELRTAYDFRPEIAGGDINEFLSIWLARFASVLRSMPFTDTFYLLNPWGPFPRPGGPQTIAIYYSHPPLLSSISAVLQNIFGEGPMPIRRLGIFLFCLRVCAFWHLARAAGGVAVGRLSVLLHLASPGTALTSHAPLFEPSALGIALLCFLSVSRKNLVWILIAAIAVFTDWTAAIWLAFLLPSLLKEKRFLGAAGLCAVILLIPAIYSHFLVGEFGPATFKVEGYPTFQARPDQVNGLDAIKHRFLGHLRGVFSGQGFAPEDKAEILRRFFLALPFFVLIPALLGVLSMGRKKLLSLPSWVFASIAGGTLLFLAFSGAFIVHTYMFLPLSFGFCFLAALGWIWLWRTLAERKLFHKASLGILLVISLGEAAYFSRLSPISEASAREIGDFHREALQLNELAQRKTAYIVKDSSLWEPNPLLVDAGDVFFFTEPRYHHRGQPHCVELNVIYSDLFQRFYGHFSLYKEIQAHLAKTEECSQDLWKGKFFRIVPGACMCNFRM